MYKAAMLFVHVLFNDAVSNCPIGQENMAMGPTRPETNNDRAGEDQQKITTPCAVTISE
jgi:hypothetical protein